MAVITIARQIGSRGDWIAEQVAKALAYEFVDRRLIEEIASITDTTVEEVERYDEKGEGGIKHFLRRLLVPDVAPGAIPLSAAAYAPELGLEFAYVSEHDTNRAAYLDRGTYQLLITTLVQDFGQTGKVVIVGRASQVILAKHPRALHIKVVAPTEQRCEQLMDSRGLRREHARKLLDQHDQWRRAYLRNFHRADWDDPLLYHLTINTGKVDDAEAVEMIVRYAAVIDQR
jgi:cytidylate kinase